MGRFPARGKSAAALIVAGIAAACSAGPESSRPPHASPEETLPERGPAVHVLERHSSALLAWREAAATDRIVVHLAAQADIDWLPDETVARIAASTAAETAALEADAFVAESNPLAHFDSGNFLYAASRLGLVREVIWVVPDATLAEPDAVRRIAQDLLVGRLQMVTEEDARSFVQDGALLRGNLLGVPLVVCRLADIPAQGANVLLDIDLAYFTIRSALSPRVEATPWILPEQVLAILEAKGVKADVATIALSTIAGTVPPEARWIARDLRRILRGAGAPDPSEASARRAGLDAETAGESERAVATYRDLAGARADDGTVFYVLARALEAAGRTLEAGSARARAERLDPLLARADLFEAERLWFNGAWEAASARYAAYAQERSEDGSEAWILRRRAACLLRLGKQEEALATLNELVGVAPELADAHAELGALLRDRGDVAGALTHLLEARRIGPDMASYAFALGSAYLQDGREDEGIRELEASIARRPCYVQARARLAAALAHAGRLADARRHLEIAIALQPANPRFRILARQIGARAAP